MPYNDPRTDLDPVAKAIIRRKARHLMRRGVFPRTDLADLEQDLSLHLLKRMPTFDPQKADWSVFVAAVVTAWGVNFLRYRYADKRDHRRTRPLPTETESVESKATRRMLARPPPITSTRVTSPCPSLGSVAARHLFSTVGNNCGRRQKIWTGSFPAARISTSACCWANRRAD